MNTPYCPNFSNKQVKAEFDELKDIFGEDEAYLLWDRNNGNSLDYAPNGALSKLFNDFLNVFNQDRKSALYAKRETLLRQFITTFGNWSKNPQSYYSSLDENGEPKISLCGYAIHNTLTKNKIDEFCKRLGFETTVDKLSDLIVDFTNKVITLSEYSEDEFNKILARVAAVLMPPKLRESVYSVGKKHGVQSVDDVYESILHAINNKDSWLKEDRGLFEKIVDFLKNLIGKIFETQSYYEKLILDATKDIIDKQSGWYKTVIQSGFAQKDIDFEKLKKSSNYHIYEVLTDLGAALDGSAAVRTLGTLYRKGEEDFHDLDFTKKYDNFSWDIHLELLEFFLNYKTATNNFKNKDKIVYKDLRQQMLDNCTLHLKRHVIYKKLSQHYKDITVKHAAKTKELGLFVTLLVDGTPVDIFYSPSPVVKHNINGITVSDFSNAFAAKLIMGREKDIRDIINFHKFNKNGSINVNYGGIVFNAASEIRQSKIDDILDLIDRAQRLLDKARSEFDKKNTKEQREKFVKNKAKEYKAQLENVKKNLKFTGYQEFGEHGIEKAIEEFENAFGDVVDFDTEDPVRIKHSSYSAPRYFIDGKHVVFNYTKAYRKAHEEYNSYLNEKKEKLYAQEAEINRLERQLAFYKDASVEQIIQKHGLYDDTIYDGAITIGERKKLSVNAKVAASTVGVLLDDDYRAALISHLQNDNISYNDIEKNSLISLTDALFDYFKRSGIKVRLITAPYDANAKAAKSSAVSIIGKFATVYYFPQDNQESAFLTVLHELLHIATTNASPFDGEGRYINDELLLRYYNIFVANLSKDSEYNKYRKQILNAKSYEELNKVPSKYRVLYHAAESAGEFLSSFINEKEVRDFVKTIKKEEQKSLFYYLHDLIKEFIDRIFRGADLIFTKNVLDDITDFLLDYNYHAEFIEQYADDDLLEQYEARQKDLEDEFSHSINYKDLINDNILPDDKLSFEDISSFNSGLYNFQTQNYGSAVLSNGNKKSYEIPITFSGNVELSEDIMLSASTGHTIVRNAQQEQEEIANNILKQFIKLYNAYERMPNISESRQRRQTKIYQAISELKDLHDAKSVEIALGYALLQLGEIDEDSGETRFASGNIYQWLLNSSKLPEPFSDVTTEQLIDAYSLGIGFYKLLQNVIPSINSKYLSKEARSQIADFLAALDAATNIWRRALFSVVGKEMDKIIDERLPYSQEEKDMYKEVCRDWLAYNFMNGDITSIGAFAKNFGHSDNPIIKMAFRLVLDAESVTQNEMYEKNARLLHVLHKCEKNLGRTLSKTWQTIFYEKDDKGVPTSYWVTEVNRGLYEKDYNEFIKQLNEKFDNVYGFHYIYDESGEPRQSVTGLRAEEETWEKGEPTYITYLKEIEKWKSERINKPYTLEYYNEMYSEPYDGIEDPNTAPAWHKNRHGLSPKTLIRYNRIIENINHYLNICTDPETGIPHPEDLTDTQYANLENWKKQLEELLNPFTEDLHYKPEEDLKIAYELRAWSKWRNELFVHTVDMNSFERERLKIYDECAKTGDFTKLDKFLKYNSTVNVNPNFIAETIGIFKDLIRAVREGESASVVRARMNKAALDRYVKGDGSIEKDLSSKERNFVFWGMQKEIDLFLEDHGGHVRKPEFAKMLKDNYRSKQIPYRDAYGTAYDVFMNPVPKDKEDSTELMSYRQYLINKFTNEAISTGKIIGYLDEHGHEIPITGSEDDIRDFVESLFSYTIHEEDPDTGLIYDRDIPLSIFSVSIPTSDTFRNVKTGRTEETITTVPSERYSFKSGSSKYINKNYDYSKQSGELINTQFDNGRYDNSKEYNKIRKDKNLSELYDLIMEVMSEAYGLISSKSQTGNYLIPKVNASTGALFTRLLSRHGAAAAQGMWRNLAEVRPDDEDYIYSSLDNTNPDGSFGTNIPLKLLGVLDDKENYTSDVVSAVSAFAHMAINYREKSKILPLLQLMQYAMDDETRSWKDEVGGTAYIPNGSAQSLKMFNRMMSSHVYENSLGNIDVSKNKGWELVLRRGVKAWQSVETLQMLSLNVLSFTVGFCDSMFKNIHASLVGKYNTLFDFAKSVSKAILRLPYMICNIGLQEANCKEIALMLLFGITKHSKEAMRNTNHARTNRILALVLMGGFTATDYFANFITLNSYLSNCKFIKGDDKLGIKEGFYTQYELKHLLKNNGVKNPSIKAFTLNLLSPVSLANAFEFKSFADANYMSRYVNETLGGINPFGKGFVKVKDKYKPYVTKKIMSDIRSKTLQRSALYNGMNPDNDKNQLTKNPLANIIFGMRRFIAQNVQHLIAGGDDFSVREFEDVDDSKIKHGRERKSFTKKVKGIKKLTLELKNNRKSYNWETNTSEDQTLTGLYRSLVALKDWLGYVINSIKGSSGQTKVKLGEVERYALRSTLIWVGMMSALIFSIISSFSWAFKNYDRPDDRYEASPILDVQKPVESVNDISRYWNERFIGNEEYKIALADILFRTYESQMTGVNPGTLSEFITSATVYKTGLDQQLGGLKWIPSIMFGVSADADELVKSGGYQHFTKRERDIWKSIGPLRNLHSAFTGPGLTANLKYYTDTYASPIKTVTGVDLKLYLKAPKKSSFVYKEPDMFEDTWSNSSTDTFGDTFSQDSGMW